MEVRNKRFKEPRDQAQKSQEPKIPRIKSLAEGEEPVAAVPTAVPVVEVQAAPGPVAVQERHAATAVPTPPHGTECHDGILPLFFGVRSSEGEKLVDGGRTETLGFHVFEDSLGGHELAVVQELRRQLVRAGSLGREVLVGDVGVDPVVLPGHDHLDQGLGVVYDNLEHVRSPLSLSPSLTRI